MTTPRVTARKLCTDAEYRLVEESFPPQVNRLRAAELRKRVVRTRRLRDKYRGGAERRAREIRNKTAQRRKAPARSNTLSRAKQKLFDETLGRFAKRLTRLDSRAAEKPTQADLAKKALAMKRSGARRRPAGPQTRTARQGMRSKPSGGAKGFFPAEGAKKGALSAAVKRGQARRDRRG